MGWAQLSGFSGLGWTHFVHEGAGLAGLGRPHWGWLVSSGLMWALIIQQTSSGLFIWQSHGSKKVSRSMLGLLRTRLSTGATSFAPHSSCQNKSQVQAGFKAVEKSTSSPCRKSYQVTSHGGLDKGKEIIMAFL